MSKRLLGVVLAGGRSSRMGQDKASLPHPDGGSFLSQAVGRLVELCDHVCVAGGSASGLEVELLNDPQPYRGPVVGVATALSYACEHRFDACLVTPVDMPFLTADDLTRLRDAWTREGQLCCGNSAADGRLEPLVAIYPAAYQAEIERLAAAEQRSLMRWMAAQQPRLIQIEARSCCNINTPQDLSE